MRALVVVAVAVFVAACSGTPAAPTVSQPGAVITAAPSVAPPPTASQPGSVLTPEPTEAPTPEPVSDVAVTNQWMEPWQDDGSDYAQAAIVVEVTNRGTTWVELDGSGSDYTIFDADGNVAITGSFSYEYPAFLGPGQVGYLAESAISDSVRAKDLKELEVNAYYTDVEEDDAIILSVSKLKNRNPEYEFESVTTTGRVTNESEVDVSAANVAAFYFDADGDVMGFSWTNLVENVAAGQTKSFETLSASPHFKVSDIDHTKVIASPSY